MIIQFLRMIRKHIFISGLLCFLIACNTQTQPPNYGSHAQDNGPSYCSDKFCLIVGDYKTTGLASHALVMRSTDHGKTFQNVSAIPLPEQSAASALLGLTCSGNICIAVGLTVNVVNSMPQISPLVIRSTDSGLTFELVTDVALPPDSAPLGSHLTGFFNIACEGTTCTAIGAYANEDLVQLPFAVQSTDSGKTFSSVSEIHMPDDFVPDVDQPALAVGIVCQSLTCVISGIYTISEARTKPLALRSEDGGRHFFETLQVALPSDSVPSQSSPSAIVGLTCGNGNCIGVGGYANSAGGETSFASISTPRNHNFDIQSILNFPSDFDRTSHVSNLISLYHVVCQFMKCIVGGAYPNSQSGASFLLLRSQNGGLAFDQSSTFSIPEDINAEKVQNGLAGLSCANQNCVAVGSYSTQIDGVFPYIANSPNFGKTFERSLFSLPNDALLGVGEKVCFGVEILSFNCLDLPP